VTSISAVTPDLVRESPAWYRLSCWRPSLQLSPVRHSCRRKVSKLLPAQQVDCNLKPRRRSACDPYERAGLADSDLVEQAGASRTGHQLWRFPLCTSSRRTSCCSGIVRTQSATGHRADMTRRTQPSKPDVPPPPLALHPHRHGLLAGNLPLPPILSGYHGAAPYRTASGASPLSAT